jgi:tetratricopeptide (TPR) repeat protein
VSEALAEARPEQAPAAPNLNLVDAENPWLGLDSFSEETRGFFHGREEEIGELARRVQRKLLAILFGQSGLGKTSILRAGIVPRLRREGYCPVYVRIDYARESPSPSEQIKQAIFRATESSGQWSRPGTAIPGESLWEFLHHRDDLLRDSSGKTITPLLIFDQFEEIFTLGQDDDFGRRRAAQFIEDLADLVENRPPKSLEAMLELEESMVERFDFNRADYRILIALREDYLAHLEGLKGQMPSITQNRMRLARMTGEQALAAVLKPGGRLVTEEVAESIVRFVAGGAELRNAEVEPSLLSLVCRELNNARKTQGRSEISADLLAGSRDTILNEFYERALADQPAGVRSFIEDAMLTESGFRESLAEERVLKGFAAAGAPAGALPALVNRRLLRIEERLDVRRVELTHDVLCTVVRASRDQRHEREAREEAERQLQAQREREAATHRALVRARKVAAGCVVLSVVAVAGAVFGWINMKRAQESQEAALKTRQLAEGARSEAEKLVVYLLDDFQLELEPIGRLDVVANLSNRALGYYAGLPPELRTPETERNRALAQARLAASLRYLARTEEAQKAAEESIATLEALRAKGDKSEAAAIGLAVALNSLGRIRTDQVRTPEAIGIAKRSVEVLQPFAAAPGASPAVRRAFGQVMSFYGFTQQRLGDDEGAFKSLQSAREAFRAIDQLKLEDLAAAAAFAESTSWLMDALQGLGRQEEARTLGEEAYKVTEQVLERRPGHMMALRSHALLASNLGETAVYEMRLKDALRYFERSVSDWDAFLRLDPGNTIAYNNHAASSLALGFTLEGLGRPAAAARTFRAAGERDVNVKLTPSLARNIFFPWAHAARVEADMGNMPASREAFTQAGRFQRVFIEGSAANPGARAIGMAVKANFEANFALMENDYATMRVKGREAAAFLETTIPPSEAGKLIRLESLARAAWYEAMAALGLRDHGEAERAGRRAVELAKQVPPRTPIQAFERIDLHFPHAIALARLGRHADARAALEPVKKHFADPKAVGDSPASSALMANALYAEAVATPERASALLAEAARRIDAAPAEMRRLKTVVKLREDIAREAANRR